MRNSRMRNGGHVEHRRHHGLDSSVLLSYYQAQLNASPSRHRRRQCAQRAQTAHRRPTAPPRTTIRPGTRPTSTNAAQNRQGSFHHQFPRHVQCAADARARPATPRLEQDNQKLFSLYSAVNTLAYLAKMAQSSTATSGQLAGLNARFQTGLAQVQQYLSSTSFNNFTLQAATPADTVTSTADDSVQQFHLSTPAAGHQRQSQQSAAGAFARPTASPSRSRRAAPPPMSPSICRQVQGAADPGQHRQLHQPPAFRRRLFHPLPEDRSRAAPPPPTPTRPTACRSRRAAIETGQLVGRRHARALHGGQFRHRHRNQHHHQHRAPRPTTTTAADQTGRLTKISGLDGTPTGIFSVNQQATTGTTTAQATVVDSSGNVYVIGNATGNFGNQLNQGTPGRLSHQI